MGKKYWDIWPNFKRLKKVWSSRSAQPSVAAALGSLAYSYRSARPTLFRSLTQNTERQISKTIRLLSKVNIYIYIYSYLIYIYSDTHQSYKLLLFFQKFLKKNFGESCLGAYFGKGTVSWFIVIIFCLLADKTCIN